MNIGVGIDELASVIFTKNTNNAHIDLNINGIRNTKDLFCFFLDMLCKGLVILYGSDNRLDLSTVTQDQFAYVQEKLACAGIKCELEVIPVETPPPVLIDIYTQNLLNVHSVRNGLDTLPLNQYHFDIQTMTHIYKIRFDTIRHVIDIPAHLV